MNETIKYTIVRTYGRGLRQRYAVWQWTDVPGRTVTLRGARRFARRSGRILALQERAYSENFEVEL